MVFSHPITSPSSQFCNELLLKIFSELTLSSLIAARSVSRKWRALISCADIAPARRVLLDLYLSVILSPHFPAIRQHRVVVESDLDYDTYVEYLNNQLAQWGHSLPDEIRYWILEWPKAAALPWAWPSFLPRDVPSSLGTGQTPNKTVVVDDVTRPLFATKYFTDTWMSGDTGIPMMELWGDSIHSGYWLALSGTGKMAEVGGRVYRCTGTEIVDQVAPSWVEWLKRRLERGDACWT